MSIEQQIDAVPIPGANYTADTRQFPWHRPPDLVDYDQAIEYMITRYSETERSDRLTALIEYGMDVTTLTSIILMSLIGKGKIATDLALLTAGPLARYLEIMAKANGVEKIELGFETDKPRATVEDIKMIVGFNRDGEEPKDEVVIEPMVEEEVTPENDSLMSMPVDTGGVASSTEQEQMLGTNAEVEEE